MRRGWNGERRLEQGPRLEWSPGNDDAAASPPALPSSPLGIVPLCSFSLYLSFIVPRSPPFVCGLRDESLCDSLCLSLAFPVGFMNSFVLTLSFTTAVARRRWRRGRWRRRMRGRSRRHCVAGLPRLGKVFFFEK